MQCFIKVVLVGWGEGGGGGVNEMGKKAYKKETQIKTDKEMEINTDKN